MSHPAFTPQPQSVATLWLVLISHPCEGSRLSWSGCLGEITEVVCWPKNRHPSQYYTHQPGIELTTIESQVQCPIQQTAKTPPSSIISSAFITYKTQQQLFLGAHNWLNVRSSSTVSFHTNNNTSCSRITADTSQFISNSLSLTPWCSEASTLCFYMILWQWMLHTISYPAFCFYLPFLALT